jgi:uncharacterized protein with PIN domain
MAVFDAAPLVGVLTAEPGAHTIAQAMAVADVLAVSSINLAEVIDRVARQTTTSVLRVLDEIERWEAGGLHVVPLTSSHARVAASLRVDHYHARRCPVSLADCCAIALARERGEALATSDRAMLRVARAIGLDVLALPDSAGRVPD